MHVLVLFADGFHSTAPTASLTESIPALIATVLGFAAFAIALRRGSGPFGRGPSGGTDYFRRRRLVRSG